MVLASGIFWGLSGTASQILFQHEHFASAWLVVIRMIFTGMVLVIWGTLKKEPVVALIRDRKMRLRLVIFAIFALAGVQYTYFKAIADGNAASATLLQYMGPPMIVGFLALRARRWPSKPALTALVLATLGTAFLVTGGHFARLQVPLPAVVWGLLSAACLAFNTLYPIPLIDRYGSMAVVGWSMLIGGVASIAIGPVWRLPLGIWTWESWLLVAFVVLLGTLAAFTLYLASLRHIAASEASLLATVEPVAAVLASMAFLSVRLDGMALAGGTAIVAAIILLSRGARPRLPAPPPSLSEE